MKFISTIKSVFYNPVFKYPAMVLVGGVLVLGMLLGLFELIYLDKNYPGLKIAEMDVGGKNYFETLSLVESKFGQVNILQVYSGNNHWTIPTEDFELRYDYPSTVNKVLGAGRGGGYLANLKWKIEAVRSGLTIGPVYTINEDKLGEIIFNISKELDIPAQEPEIVVVRNGGGYHIEVLSGENGQETDTRRLTEIIKTSLKNGLGQNIEVPIIKLEPKLSEIQMELARSRTENLVNKSLIINFPEGEQNWEITDEQIIAWVDPMNYSWKRDQIEGWINQLSEGIDKEPQNASLRFENKRVVEFKPAHDGIRVKQSEMLVRIIEELKKMETGQAVTPLVLITETFPPDIKTADVNSLGLKEIIGRGESWFSGSINNRIFNLKKSAEALSGVLIAPGEIFSFNQHVGEISAATGYKPAYIIKEGKTILGDGGGVCQTSSTLFRAVLAAGLPIEERVAHAYRVHYYEENYQVGFDATIFQPSPDFKFKNDTPNHVLIQMVYDEKKKYLAFELYGTNDGRKVEISKSRTWEVVPPPPDLYVDDPNLPVGTVRQIEHQAWGAKVAFDWKVVRGEEVLQDRTFYSNYRPWQAVYMRGTKI